MKWLLIIWLSSGPVYHIPFPEKDKCLDALIKISVADRNMNGVCVEN